MPKKLNSTGTPKRPVSVAPSSWENVEPVNYQVVVTPVQSPVKTSVSAYYDDDLYGPKTQKINFKPPARNSCAAIYEWAGYEFCLTKSFLNEKSCGELRKKYKGLKELPPGLDYNAIHSAASLNPDMLEVMLQQYRDFLNDTQLVAPGQYESLFHYLERVHKLQAKTEKKSKTA